MGCREVRTALLVAMSLISIVSAPVLAGSRSQSLVEEARSLQGLIEKMFGSRSVNHEKSRRTDRDGDRRRSSVGMPATVSSPKASKNGARQKPPSAPFAATIKQASRRHKLPVALIAAVIRCESNWNPVAVSSAGARGLMQVMPDTAEIFGVEAEELWDPDTNIAVGSAYLGRLAHRFRKDVPEMVAAYNAGPTRALNGHPLPRETVLYRRCVNRWYQRFRKVGGRARPAKGPS